MKNKIRQIRFQLSKTPFFLSSFLFNFSIQTKQNFSVLCTIFSPLSAAIRSKPCHKSAEADQLMKQSLRNLIWKINNSNSSKFHIGSKQRAAAYFVCDIYMAFDYLHSDNDFQLRCSMLEFLTTDVSFWLQVPPGRATASLAPGRSTTTFSRADSRYPELEVSFSEASKTLPCASGGWLLQQESHSVHASRAIKTQGKSSRTGPTPTNKDKRLLSLSLFDYEISFHLDLTKESRRQLLFQKHLFKTLLNCNSIDDHSELMNAFQNSGMGWYRAALRLTAIRFPKDYLQLFGFLVIWLDITRFLESYAKWDFVRVFVGNYFSWV